MQPFAVAPVAAAAAAVVAVLVAVAGRYGYHRDELYFLAAGHHLAWGYADQPPLVPALARVLSAVAPGSVVALRAPSAIAAGLIVVLTALTARELGASRLAQTLAATSVAVGSVLAGTGHLLSTATFDFLAWTVIIWLVVRLGRTGNRRLWLAIGVVAGVGLLDTDLVAFLMAALVLGLVVAGPRDALRSPWLWVGGAIAAAMWSPYLAWQAAHGWPQLAVSRSIAAGHSGTSTPRWLVVPEQLFLLSPWLAPVLIAGFFSLWRTLRSLVVAYVALAAVFTATGGKGYYLAGFFPVLVAAGSPAAAGWMRSGRASIRRMLFVAALAVTALGSFVVALPVLPLSSLHATPILSVNHDIGETVGWPIFVNEIAAAYRALPPSTVIVGSNYGESGAVDRYGAAKGLPHAYGVHNGYWYWGPPPASATHALLIGFDAAQVAELCLSSTVMARLDNHLDLDNDEQGRPLRFCDKLAGSWASMWPKVKNIG
ncbi:MAG: glycosyltransferase family 39 protein [Acidimicrobiales bacterium]